MERIISLLPSTTEIACALGFGEQLVGRSHECDFPADVVRLPVLTEPKLDSTRSSPEIDHRVRQLVREGLSVYRIDIELLRQLEPSVILTQDQCEVCAASLKDVERALAEWTGRVPRVVSLDPSNLGDVWRDVQHVADELGTPERGRKLRATLTDRITEVAERCARIQPQPSVLCIEWIDPLMSAGNWMPELVALAGGQNLLAQSGAHSPWLDWSQIVEADPDVIVVMPCGFDLARTRGECPPLLGQPGWSDLRAVRDGRVFVTDGQQYFNRPGPRLVESLEILAEILHPELVEPTRRGVAWEVLEPQ